MSGGAFDYRHYHFQAFSEELRTALEGKNEGVSCPDMCEETHKLLLQFADECDRLAKLAHAVEYYFSRDTGEDSLKAAFEEFSGGCV